MIPLDYYLDLLGRPGDLWSAALVFFLLCLYTKAWVGRLFNGLVLVNLSSAIVIWIAIDLYSSRTAPPATVAYLLTIEVLVYALVVSLYKYVVRYLTHLPPAVLAASLYANRWIVYAAYGLQIALQLIFIEWDGSSRIAYQTASWYSPFRLLFQFLAPVAVMAVFVLAANRRSKTVPAIFLLLIVATSVTAASKSGFVFTLVIGYLLYRDVYGPLRWAKWKKLTVIAVVAVLSIGNLIMLGVDALKVGERITHYAEATIMLLPADDPTAACKDNSTIAKLHRGFGRLFGDRSSMDVDRLFGFALHLEVYGTNTLTGPNARIGAYALCSFGISDLWLLALAYAACVWFCFLALYLARAAGILVKVAIALLVIHLAQHLSMDYNTAMSDLTAFGIICCSLLLRQAIHQAAINARSCDAGGDFKHV